MKQIFKVSKGLKTYLEENKDRLPWLYYNFMIKIEYKKEYFEEIGRIIGKTGEILTIGAFISLFLQGEIILEDGKYFSFVRPVLTGDFEMSCDKVEEEYELVWYTEGTYTMVQSKALKVHESDTALINKLVSEGWDKREVFNL